MKEIDSQSKARVVPVAIVAGLGMAGMGLVSDGVVVADTTSVTDTINVTVQTSCTFNSVEDKTYNGSAANGTEVSNFNDSGKHEFNLFCNDNNGYIVTARAYDLGATGINDVISYTDNYTASGVNSMWTAEIESDTAGVTATSPVSVGGGTIISSDSNTTAGGASFTATYKAYVGTATPAGTYTGTIVYTLTASGTSNNSGSGSGSGGTGQNDNGGNGGTDSGNEVTDNANNGGGSGNSGSGSGSGDNGSGDSNGTQNSPQNASPTMLNNTYNTYNTYNTTNTYGGTTNYSGGGTSTPVVINAQDSTSGNMDDLLGETSGDTTSTNGTGAGDNYEKPLGVTTTTTSSSNTDPGIDWVPLAVTAGALAVAGVAAIAVSQKDKEKE